MAVSPEQLYQLSFFSELDGDALNSVASQVQEYSFDPGQVVVWEGEDCQGVYVVSRGLVRTLRLSLDGREQVLAYLGPGEPVNLVSALDGKENLAGVDAVSEAVLYFIPCERFHLMMGAHHQVALAVSRHLAAEVRRLSDMVEDLALHTVRTRLARFLLSQADGAVGSKRRWTQEEIAAQLGTVREMIGRTLRAFADTGLVRRQRGQIVVVDREGLEREAAMAV